MSTNLNLDAAMAPELKTRLIAGLAVVGTMVLGVGGWAAMAELSGAVIAPGKVVIEGSSKKVQHPTGGVIGAILVKEGDRVAANDVVLRLDDTQTRAALGVVQSQLVELTGRKARLAAESNADKAIVFPQGFETADDASRQVAAGERRLFEARRTTLEGQSAQLNERIGQFNIEIDGLAAQRDAKKQEVTLIEDELGRVRGLSDKSLVPVTRLLASEREALRVKAEYGALVAQIARLQGQISETRLQILSLEQNLRTEAQKELREVEARISELSERKSAADDQMRRIEIRAPHAGVVHQLAVHTVGGVIGPGDALMTIVPDDEPLTVEIKISPADIDQIIPGQKTHVRFPAFNQRTTPELAGTLKRIAADLTQEERSGMSYYVATVTLAPAEIAKLDRLKLVPGMPVETFTETEERTALSYFTRPLTDQFTHAFREN
jgi:HlyD family secretion protein